MHSLPPETRNPRSSGGFSSRGAEIELGTSSPLRGVAGGVREWREVASLCHFRGSLRVAERPRLGRFGTLWGLWDMSGEPILPPTRAPVIVVARSRVQLLGGNRPRTAFR